MKPIKISQCYIDAAQELLRGGKLARMREQAPWLRGHNDAAVALGFARQLEFVEGKLAREEMRPFESQKFVPMVSEGGDWAETITHRQVTDFGSANWIAETAKDVPMVGLATAEASRTIKTFATGWAYNYWDVARAAYLSVNLSMEKPRIARTAIERFHDGLMATGTSLFGGIKGFANATTAGANANGVTDATSLLGASGDDFDSDTAINIVTGVCNVINSVQINTNGVHRANTCAMPLAFLAVLKARPYGVAENSTSIFQVLQDRNPGVTFDSWEALSTAAAGGGARLMAWDKHEDVAKYHAPVPFNTLPPQSDGMTTVTVAYARTGFVEIRLPKAISVADLTALG